jgi:hypothetical protein
MHTLVAENLANPLRIRPSLKERLIIWDRGHLAQTAGPAMRHASVLFPRCPSVFVTSRVESLFWNSFHSLPE